LRAARVLPTELQIGDRLTDETGEWEIIGRSYTTNAGKDAHARIKKVGQPDVTGTRTSGRARACQRAPGMTVFIDQRRPTGSPAGD
jgi:hypothetical protein